MIIPGNGSLSDKFFELQKTISPDYAIEIGAHAAEFSVAMSKELGVMTTAFEANPVVFDKFRHINSDLLNYVHYAIWDKNEPMNLNIHAFIYAGDNSLKIRQNAQIIKQYLVPAYTLDTYFKNVTFKNAALWVDVEGANREVLSGAVETLKRCSSIFIETEDFGFWKDQWLTEDVVLFLESQGFKAIDMENVYSKQKNIIFVREGINNDNETN